jgi:hypothetical protein
MSLTKHRLPQTIEAFLEWELSQPKLYEFIGAVQTFDEPSDMRYDFAHHLKSLLRVLRDEDQLCSVFREIREPYTRTILGDYIVRPDLVVTREDVRRDPCNAAAKIFLIESGTSTKVARHSAMTRHLSINALCSVVTLREDKVAASISTVWGSSTMRVKEAGEPGRLYLPEINIDVPLRDVYEGILAA